MFRSLLYSLTMISILVAQDYRWPIRASQSLSATFSEWRSGHLHAGIDIKTWGEMNVRCVAIEDGYIERILVGYNGYGRGLFLRLNDGNLAVYGHLERFTPDLEALIQSKQLENDKYAMRLKFTPDQYPIKKGSTIGYSGTSGTEHPHLHFEIRDSLRQVLNPQLFYPDIKDTQSPVFDEILLIPAGDGTRINGSLFPVTLDMQKSPKPVSISGPFQVAINAHDRSNGTYNKYNIYTADIMVNDSVAFSRTFDKVLNRVTDDVEEIYPGMRGKRGWRFMSMYNNDLDTPSPFAPENLSGLLTPQGISTLQISVADIKRNQTVRGILLQEQIPGKWQIKQSDSTYIITRYFPESGYENIQFFSGGNTFIPISETLYRLNSTSWVVQVDDASQGIRALGASGGKIKWITPPLNQIEPPLDYTWRRKADGFVLELDSESETIFPISYSLENGGESLVGELIQTGPTTAETDIIDLSHRVNANSIELHAATGMISSHKLHPLQMLPAGSTQEISTPVADADAVLSAHNSGKQALYFQIDTALAKIAKQPVVGISVGIIQPEADQFSAKLSFTDPDLDSSFAIFSQGKKRTWQREVGMDSTGQLQIDLDDGGTYFLFQDMLPPAYKALKPFRRVNYGERLVFKISDNSGILPYPRAGFEAFLNGDKFFPDYNPLRHEISFHVPRNLGSGQHLFELLIKDQSGNQTTIKHRFSIKS